MDPSSQAFTPYNTSSATNETWRLQGEVTRLHQIQIEHADRLARLERRQDDDVRIKNVWGQSSPFPSVLTGTPQQAPLQHPSADQFRNFDDETTQLISSLHLDPEEEPRRGMGATSRANSVRFDESANQNHFSHSSRPSMDLMSRTSSGLGGGLRMDERTSSHKSEGRASSVHSMRSAASGRAGSLNLDGTFGADSARSPMDTPAIAPGLLLLGAAPAIVRCWLTNNFKNDTLLYVAFSTASYQSTIDLRMVRSLGLEASIRSSPNRVDTIELPVYFTEAVPHSSSSRPSSPAPQLPMITVEFQIFDSKLSQSSKAVQIFIGSNVMRLHGADVLFSSNRVTLIDEENTKISIPLVRPEDDVAFNNLTTLDSSNLTLFGDNVRETSTPDQPFVNGLVAEKANNLTSSAISSASIGRYRPPGSLLAEGSVGVESSVSDPETRPSSRISLDVPRPPLHSISIRPEGEDVAVTSDNAALPARVTPTVNGPASATAISWRRESGMTTPLSSTATNPLTLDWAAASRARASDANYQRKDAGIKILKPKTAVSRTVSTSVVNPPGVSSPITPAQVASPSEGRSRFFDEGRRRSGGDASALGLLGSKSGATTLLTQTPAATSPMLTSNPLKAKANPIGGASAFSWLNPAGSASSKT